MFLRYGDLYTPNTKTIKDSIAEIWLSFENGEDSKTTLKLPRGENVKAVAQRYFERVVRLHRAMGSVDLPKRVSKIVVKNKD